MVNDLSLCVYGLVRQAGRRGHMQSQLHESEKFLLFLSQN
jgi:hypothetical protein